MAHTTKYLQSAYMLIFAFFMFQSCKVASLRLGQHSTPAKGVAVLGSKFPPPPVFFHHFMQGSQGLLMKDVLNDTNYPAFRMWTDEYLKKHYGDELVYVELSKKERRGEERLPIRLGRFLDNKKQDMYLVHTVPQAMREEAMLPATLRCGGFQRVLQDSMLWMSQGDTDSVLHQDDLHNLNCLLDGSKEIVLYDPAYKHLIEAVGWVQDGAYSEMDPTDVDAVKYNAIYQAPWYQVNMRKGDCVFIPKRWYHYVHSPPGRNLAVNIWFSHFWWFNQTDCEGVDRSNVPLLDVKFRSSNEPLRTELFAPFGGKMEILQKHFVAEVHCEEKDMALKMFQRLNQNGDIKLTWEEMYSVDVDTLIRDFSSCFKKQITAHALDDTKSSPQTDDSLGNDENTGGGTARVPDAESGPSTGGGTARLPDAESGPSSGGGTARVPDAETSPSKKGETVVAKTETIPSKTVETTNKGDLKEDKNDVPSYKEEDSLDEKVSTKAKAAKVVSEDIDLTVSKNDGKTENSAEVVGEVGDNKSDNEKHSKHTEL
ncbi:uncharacterized protein LOC127877397 isoform X2 [Dreissena polymorpha]|uniref:uncharacterized protein LOC127877397 isoform X2 n=1 Tax=Dreissena polymorpha TaxID=45954 RepID=UPI002263C922|nr:uncharacterized protein LOC127877397 isoform X2 [Dreissena polymorpha]